MKQVNLIQALQICGNHHSSKITLNHLRDNDSQVSDSIPLVIHECCAAVINELLQANFSLSMGKEGLHVDDYCK
jgi:hypothetical protein